MRVQIQDLEINDVILPSQRVVTNVTFDVDTPDGFRVVELGGNEVSRHIFRGDVVVEVQREQ